MCSISQDGGPIFRHCSWRRNPIPNEIGSLCKRRHQLLEFWAVVLIAQIVEPAREQSHDRHLRREGFCGRGVFSSRIEVNPASSSRDDRPTELTTERAVTSWPRLLDTSKNILRLARLCDGQARRHFSLVKSGASTSDASMTCAVSKAPDHASVSHHTRTRSWKCHTRLTANV